MKTIRREIPARTEVGYQCEICGTEYRTADEAVRCEKRNLEEKSFKVGQKVSARELRRCQLASRPYKACGVVKMVLGPILPDRDYEIRHLGGAPQRMNSHVWHYIVWWKCPHCEKIKQHVFYAPELKAVEKKK